MIQVLQAISLVSTAHDELTGSTVLLYSATTFEWMLTTLAVGSLILSTILFFSVSVAHRHLEQHLSQTVADSAAANDRLRQETRELAAMNKELLDTITGLSGYLKEVPENIAGAVSS